MKDRSGHIYILSNPSMPGLLKIGRSFNGGRNRANELYGTGVPTNFKMEFEMWSKDCVDDENLIHSSLDKHRENKSREFFRIDIDSAIKEVVSTISLGYGLDTFEICTAISRIFIADKYFSKSLETLINFFEGQDFNEILEEVILNHLSQESIIEGIKSYKNFIDRKKHIDSLSDADKKSFLFNEHYKECKEMFSLIINGKKQRLENNV